MYARDTVEICYNIKMEYKMYMHIGCKRSWDYKFTLGRGTKTLKKPAGV